MRLTLLWTYSLHSTCLSYSFADMGFGRYRGCALKRIHVDARVPFSSSFLPSPYSELSACAFLARTTDQAARAAKKNAGEQGEQTASRGASSVSHTDRGSLRSPPFLGPGPIPRPSGLGLGLGLGWVGHVCVCWYLGVNHLQTIVLAVRSPISV